MSLVRYRIWAAIAGVVALAGLVSFFTWAARYDGAILIPFLVIGGIAPVLVVSTNVQGETAAGPVEHDGPASCSSISG